MVNVFVVNREDLQYVEDNALGKMAQRYQKKGDSVEANLLPMGAVTTVDMNLYTEVDDKLVVVAVGKEAEHENVFKQYSKQAEFVLNTLL